MPNNDFVMPNGKWNTLATPAAMSRLDQHVSELIDGEEGGTWNPSAPITVGGECLSLESTGCKILGGVRTAQGGRLALGPNHYPVFDARNRDVVVPLRSVLEVSEADFDGTNDYAAVPGSLRLRGTLAQIMIPPLGLHPGATLTAFRLRFRVGVAPSAVPSRMPAFRIVRAPADGTVSIGPANASELYFIPSWQATAAHAVGDLVIPTVANGHQYRCIVAGTSGGAEPAWSTVDGATQVDGGVTWRVEPGPNNLFFHYAELPRPDTAAAYFAGGRVQEIVLVPNANQIVDPSRYYIAEIIDESGTQNVFHSLVMSMAGITDMRPT